MRAQAIRTTSKLVGLLGLTLICGTAQAQWIQGSSILSTTNRVGIGTSAPFGALHVTSTSNGVGLIRGDNAGTGPAIFGYATATSGFNYGVLGASLSPNGRGVWGIGIATTGDSIGVRGTSYSATGYGGVFDGGQYGIFSQSASPGGATVGVWGQVSSPDGWGGVFKGGRYGVWGEVAGDDNYAGYFIGNVYASARVGIGTATPEEALHVVGNIRLPTTVTIGGPVTNGSFGSLTLQASGNGSSFGSATSGGTLFLKGGNCNLSHGGVPPPTGTAGGNDVIIAAGDNVFTGAGFDVWNGNIRFLAGDADSNGSVQPERVRIVGDNGFVGIGTTSPTNRLTVAGNADVTGTLAKGGGSFKIDHPLDPTNKYLYHSFVESPDMMNIYNGNAVTDGAGFATITLPDWFESLNREFRYQLTVVDEGSGTWTMARVVRKVENNQFTIQTSTPGVEVSWQITGVRKDAFANANRIPTEVEKAPRAKGTYLHPEAFGKPQSMGEHAQQQVDGNGIASAAAAASR